MSRSRAAIGIAALVLVLGLAAWRGPLAGLLGGRLASPSPVPVALASIAPSPVASPSAPTSPSPSPSLPAPSPSPSLVPGPLDGLPVTAAAAALHPIAVMVDDLAAARPQSGFSAASVVWQAPAEGGIPRYMMVFQSQTPAAVGPVRSARDYYIAWAAEWRAVYVHAGGSPQALQTLAAKGNGQLVYNADDFRYEGRYLWRVTTRYPPHNLYTDGRHLRQLAKVVHAPNTPLAPAWQFAPDAALADRPAGGSISVAYPYNRITYRYDQASNTYRRSVTGETVEKDAGTGTPVAPKNVIVMLMHFGPLNDGHPQKGRLEATVVGSGPAWISTNGLTIKGTWRKTSLTAPTRFFGPGGTPVTLTAGQTFVQVLPVGSAVTIVRGTPPSALGTDDGTSLDGATALRPGGPALA